MTEARIQLSNGVLFDLLEPDSELIEIEAIAHSLSQLCRFTGHSAAFYSVAQHCVVVSRLVSSEQALAGLLHDASEAFVGDVATPLKRLLPDYRTIEDRISEAIEHRFGLGVPAYAEIKHADLIAMSTERRSLGLTGNGEYWGDLPDPASWTIVPLGINEARVAFLARFAEIVLRPGQGQVPAEFAERWVHEQPDPHRFENNEDVSRRLSEAEADEVGDHWEVVG